MKLIPKVDQMIPRWKIFPREIESDLQLYHRIDIGDWYSGKLSSRRAIILLDGLPGDSWYKLSVAQYIEEVAEEEEYRYADDVGSLIFAQLSGQQFDE